MLTGVETNLQVHELMALFVLLLGYVPVVLNYVRDRQVWLFAAYSALLVGVLATNLEAFIFPAVLNGIEHVVGIMGAGILFAGCAYHSNSLFVVENTPERENRRER